MNRLLYAISGRLPCRIITDNDSPYLERYYLCTVLGVTFYLHRFVASDPDRGLHDHPWSWAFSLVLSGWYLEERRSLLNDGLAQRPVRWFNVLTGDSFHRVILPPGVGSCWTLFCHSAENVKSWGFMRPYPNAHTMLWSRYAYTGGSMTKWWLSALPGRFDKRRMAP